MKTRRKSMLRRKTIHLRKQSIRRRHSKRRHSKRQRSKRQRSKRHKKQQVGGLWPFTWHTYHPEAVIEDNGNEIVLKRDFLMSDAQMEYYNSYANDLKSISWVQRNFGDQKQDTLEEKISDFLQIKCSGIMDDKNFNIKVKKIQIAGQNDCIRITIKFSDLNKKDEIKDVFQTILTQEDIAKYISGVLKEPVDLR